MYVHGVGVGEIVVLGGLAVVATTALLIAVSILVVDHARRDAPQVNDTRKDGG